MNINDILTRTFFTDLAGNTIPGYMDSAHRSRWRQTKEFKDTNRITTTVLNGVGPYRAGILKDLASARKDYPSWEAWVHAYTSKLVPADLTAAYGRLTREGGVSEAIARNLAIIRLIDEPFLGAAREKAAVEFLAESLGTAWAVRPAFQEEDMNWKVDLLAFPFESGTPKIAGIQVKALSFALSPRIGSQRLRMRKDLLVSATALSEKYELPAVTGVLFYEGADSRSLSWRWAPAEELTDEKMSPMALEMPWISQKMGLYTPEERI